MGEIFFWFHGINVSVDATDTYIVCVVDVDGVPLLAASFLSQFKRQSEETHLCCLVVDSGYSFTHIIPYYNGKKLTEGVRRCVRACVCCSTIL